MLASCDMATGIQWLRELGLILWNFKKLTMKFSYGGEIVELQGLEPLFSLIWS